MIHPPKRDGWLLQSIPKMTPEQEREQRISFVYGNVGMSNPSVTRKMVEEIADRQPAASWAAPVLTDPAQAHVEGARLGDWIQVYGGQQFWPMDPRASEVDIYDIAHSLSMQARYTGHGERFYSVAEHSVLMARWVPQADKLHALLHDASEAYLTDVPRPVKPFLPGYKEAERRVQEAVWDRFGMHHGNPYSVDTADARILNDERAQNMRPSSAEWSMPSPVFLGVTLEFWSPAEAEREFLALFHKLTEPT